MATLKFQGHLTTRAAFVPSSFNEERNSIELTWTTGARGLRSPWFGEDYYEELEVSESAVDLSRLNNGAPVLNAHNAYTLGAVIGVVERAWISNGQGRAIVKFSNREDVKPIVKDIRDGILQHLSVGYSVQRYEKTESVGEIPVYRATKWTPAEISFVPIGFDDGATTRARALNPWEVTVYSGSEPQENKSMDENEKRAIEMERQRSAEVLKVCIVAERQGLPQEFTRALAERNPTVAEARGAVLDELAKRSEAQPPTRGEQATEAGSAGFGARANGIQVGKDWNAPNERTAAMSRALTFRSGGSAKLDDQARQFAGLSMVDMARNMLESRGIRTGLMSKVQIVRAGLHSTSDFGALLTETGNRSLLEGYGSFTGGWREVSRRTEANDFRPTSRLRLSEAPALLKKPEGAEIQSGTMAESKQGYSLSTFARIFGITREAIINDDLGAFDMVRKFGMAAAELEAKTLSDLVIAAKLPDGNDVFTTGRGNLAVATAGPISISSLGAGLAAMRTLKSLDGKTLLNVVPAFLVVPAELEVIALQHVAELAAAEPANVNPFAGTAAQGDQTRRPLRVVVDPRLDADSKLAWYLASDSSNGGAPNLEHAYLSGENGPTIEQRIGWETLGVEFRVYLDFGAAVVAPEGLYCNPGE